MKTKGCVYCGDKSLKRVAKRLDEQVVLECAKCKLMMVEDISDDTKSMYDKTYFEKQKDTHVGYTSYLSSPSADLVGKFALAKLSGAPKGRHLDLGSADGSLMEIFDNEGYETYGIEISKYAAEIAQRKGLEVTVGTTDKFPGDYTGFSLVTAFDLLEHLETLKPTMQEIYTNLIEGGYFVFSTLCVKDKDESDYWFNNSLEHYIYFNEESLKNVLRDTFGEENFGFVELKTNGVSEFWGFAKKGAKLNTEERKLLETITGNEIIINDAEKGYYLSLFYNQVSNFKQSRAIISKYTKTWTEEQVFVATFLNLYLQGQFEKITQLVKSHENIIPLNSIVYWQAMLHVNRAMSKIKTGEYMDERDAEVQIISQELFSTREELNSITKSKIVGSALWVRSSYWKVFHYVRHTKHKTKAVLIRLKDSTRRIVSAMLPHRLRYWMKKALLAKRKSKYDVIPNSVWKKNIPLVSVVEPFFNQEKTVDETYKSILGQTFANFELIIVDDGSSDPKSLTKLEEIATRDPRIQIVHQKNQKVAAARNTGLKIAKGKYIICLDSDDLIDPTYIEKAVTVLETDPEVSLITTHMDIFGASGHKLYRNAPYDPLRLYKNNMVTTAGAFCKSAWNETGGYKSGIGYEDWELWLTMAENGHWGRLIPEALFRYRTALNSGYLKDRDDHSSNVTKIRGLHKNYSKKIKKILYERDRKRKLIEPATAFVNLSNKMHYRNKQNGKPNTMVAMSWMTFGGAETLIYNFCDELKDKYNITFVTGLPSDHEWEYKFKQISERVYHLYNLSPEPILQLEFVSNYIKTRGIEILHIVHASFLLEHLEELKKRHPQLKVIVTLFNDRADHFKNTLKYRNHIDEFSSDNQIVTKQLKKEHIDDKMISTIPNGINSKEVFNPSIYNREEIRSKLGIDEDDLAVFFVGRLSEEKNPDKFIKAAKNVVANGKKVKFYVIGDGPMRRKIQAMVPKNKRQDIRILGYKKNIAEYLSAADIFVLPSSIEGFPLSILEAMAMESVVVASKVGAVPEVIEDGSNGILITPGSVEEITAAVIRLEKDHKLLESIRKQSRKSIKSIYSSEKLGNNYHDMYSRLLAEQGSLHENTPEN